MSREGNGRDVRTTSSVEVISGSAAAAERKKLADRNLRVACALRYTYVLAFIHCGQERSIYI